MPSFAHGQTGVSGVGRTASGISMLMGAASGSIKTVVKNVDDFILKPMGKGLFHFNMQFDFDEKIKGDLEVRAMGTESLMAKEVKSQRIGQFLQTVASPTLAPFAKFQYLIQEYAETLGLDPDKAVNDMEEAMYQAEILKQFQPAAPPPGQPPQQGGEIGTGGAPAPGQQGFSGNEQPQGQQGAPQQPQAGGQPAQGMGGSM